MKCYVYNIEVPTYPSLTSSVGLFIHVLELLICHSQIFYFNKITVLNFCNAVIHVKLVIRWSTRFFDGLLNLPSCIK